MTATAAAARGRACAFGVDPKASDVEECVQALRAVTKATFDDYIGEMCGDSEDAPRELEGEWGENQEFVAWLGKGCPPSSQIVLRRPSARRSVASRNCRRPPRRSLVGRDGAATTKVVF